MSRVVLVHCEGYEGEGLMNALRRAVNEVGGMSNFVKPGDRVLLKPNLLCAREPERCVTTHPEVVRGVARLVVEAGGTPFIGDSPAVEQFGRVIAKTGMRDMARQEGLEIGELTEPVVASLPGNAVFKRLEIASPALAADVIINLPKLKTHCQMLMTLGVKNLFGTIVALRKAEWHYMAGTDRDTFATLLLDVYLTVRPALTILDGIWGMEGRGPANGRPRHLKVIAAAVDAVALDISMCHLLNVPLGQFPLYRAAHSRGIGETDIGNIIFVGDAPETFDIRKFQVPSLDALGVLPGIFDRLSKRFLISKPIPDEDFCTGCGECAQICWPGAIRVEDKKAIIEYDRCIRCYCCQEVCPHNAIQFKKGLLVRLLNLFNR
ncbi:MAG: DUF362 domain-containing protein [Deltaproteobacteria bacterium]|nr:DUF362 domain-containing protein [Deltaproteobacteria bacterium]